eukprot:gnl/Trimastix_PCT/945.p1 GENE.gnl/Trimastix_PCT/945~~gnl/Trimastix_PCT/945.p1  ORF type:complete len:427 (-),score=101.58 gnl/Trimastix_PCT/945:23-1303(-)
MSNTKYSLLEQGQAQPVHPGGMYAAPTKPWGVDMNEDVRKKKKSGCRCCATVCGCCICCIVCVIIALLVIGVIVAVGVYASVWAYCRHPAFHKSDTFSYSMNNVDKIVLKQKLAFALLANVNIKQRNDSSSFVELIIQRSGVSKKEIDSIPYKHELVGNVFSLEWTPKNIWWNCRHVNVDIYVPKHMSNLRIEISRDFSVNIKNTSLGKVKIETQAGETSIQNSALASLKLKTNAGATKLNLVDLDAASKVSVGAGALTASNILFNDKLELYATAGNCEVKRIEGKNAFLIAKADAGRLALTDIKVRNVSATTTMGALQATRMNLEGGKLTLRTTAGAQDIYDVINGDIDAEATAGYVQLKFKNNSYRARFSLKSAVGARSAEGPHVHIDKAGANPLTGTIQGAGTHDFTLRARTTAGMVKLIEEA